MLVDAGTVGRVCKALEDHVKDLCDDGKSPYPIGCGKDRDGGGKRELLVPVDFKYVETETPRYKATVQVDLLW